jgi:RNA 3'-terminal phosphate cyclase
MVLKFKGSKFFRQRILCATLSGKPILIKDIRVRDENPGLRGMALNSIVFSHPFSFMKREQKRKTKILII